MLNINDFGKVLGFSSETMKNFLERLHNTEGKGKDTLMFLLRSRIRCIQCSKSFKIASRERSITCSPKCYVSHISKNFNFYGDNHTSSYLRKCNTEDNLSHHVSLTFHNHICLLDGLYRGTTLERIDFLFRRVVRLNKTHKDLKLMIEKEFKVDTRTYKII